MSGLKKSAKVKKDEETGELYLDLSDFSDYVDAGKVGSYEMVINEDKTITIKFYDKNGKNLLPKK